MPISSEAVSVLSGLSKTAQALITFGLERKQKFKAREEAKEIDRMIGEQENKQFKFDLGMSKKALDLRKSNAAQRFSNAMKRDKLATEEEQYELGKLNTQSFNRGVESLGMQDEDWSYKNKVLSRF